MQNSITILRDPVGQDHQDHENKANILWEAFKNRLGTSEYTHIYFDLPSLLIQDLDLSWLDNPFSKEEFDSIISELPNNKSPGPDGFNGEFLKKFWNLIAADFYELCEGFFERDICVQSINTSYITLIPEKDCPISVGDFRHISLLNSFIKLITKILAERLQKVIIRLIHKNQYGFIKSRTIQDCLAWAF